jgi:DnaK suppressor protein
MTKTELAKYKKFLEDRLAELSEVVRNREGIAIEKNADALDEVQHAAERELAIRNLDRESHMLRNVRGALRRMNEGAFGICVRCEEEINPKRLSAVPWTPFCICVRCEEEINPKRLSAVPWTPFCITCQEWADQQQGHEDQFDMFENEPAMVA